MPTPSRRVGRRGRFRELLSDPGMVDRNAQAVAAQLLTLPAQDRARLAALLLASLEGSDPETTEAWNAEIARRRRQLESGEVQGVPAAEVFAEVERRLKA